MAKRLVGGLLVGALLSCAGGIAQQAVVLPPAEEEVTVLEEAFSQVEDFFRGFIVEMKTSLATLGARVEELARTPRGAGITATTRKHARELLAQA